MSFNEEMLCVNKVIICENGTRDGFQSIIDFIPTKLKLEIIKRILDAEVKYMQLTSFVSPKAIPQLADAREISEFILAAYPQVRFNAYVPNLYGAARAVECGYKEISYGISVSESHNRANINRTHDQSFEELQKILQQYPELKVMVGFPTAFGCPFEGETSLENLMTLVRRAVHLGINFIGLSDTIGVAYPTQVDYFIKALQLEFPKVKLSVHIHDTRNMGMVNTWTAIQNGVTFIDSAIGGLGGCPFAPGASGNISTEDLVYMLDHCGVETGIDFEKILEAARFTKSVIKGNYSGHQITISKKCM
jgi:hydroxymethylglutaryl-CoA lyase